MYLAESLVLTWRITRDAEPDADSKVIVMSSALRGSISLPSLYHLTVGAGFPKF